MKTSKPRLCGAERFLRHRARPLRHLRALEVCRGPLLSVGRVGGGALGLGAMHLRGGLSGGDSGRALLVRVLRGLPPLRRLQLLAPGPYTSARGGSTKAARQLKLSFPWQLRTKRLQVELKREQVYGPASRPVAEGRVNHARHVIGCQSTQEHEGLRCGG